MRPFITHVVVANANEASFLAAEAMFQREAKSTAIALVWQVGRAFAIPDGHIVEPLFSREFSAGEPIPYCGEPCSCDCGLLHPFFNFWRRPFYECGMECRFALTPRLPVCCASSSYTVAVCVDVDWLISGEGASKHFCCVD